MRKLLPSYALVKVGIACVPASAKVRLQNWKLRDVSDAREGTCLVLCDLFGKPGLAGHISPNQRLGQIS
jgi:hypothetical protein